MAMRINLPPSGFTNTEMLPEIHTDDFPGLIMLFGSGETSNAGRKVFDLAMQKLPPSPRIALLETPAGFEVNSAAVIGRVEKFLQISFQNYNPQLTTIPARKRGTPLSPDEPEVVVPLLEADLIFLGPGSPTYAVRQLHDSLAWNMVLIRHHLGATLALASAATIAISACALPVYEIYKVGEDLHWKEGLNFFGLYGLDLVFIPHWNNQEGGAELDTSRCFMGKTRFAKLMDMLPEETTVIGLDEKTALIIDPSLGLCNVSGLGSVTLLHCGHTRTFQNKESFALDEIGPFHMYKPEALFPMDIWQQALRVQKRLQTPPSPTPPEEIINLVKQREQARARQDWLTSDLLRQQIIASGWRVMDTKDGPVISPGE